MNRRPAIVAYDISDDSTRRGALRVLREWRLDGQLSVHECLLDQHEATELFVQLSAVLDPATDRLLLAWIHPHRAPLARGRGRTDGIGRRLWNIR